MRGFPEYSNSIGGSGAPFPLIRFFITEVS
ncbi:MAG: hypothetical protein H6Q31_1602 [Bacteroidetes bacterium]|nr:hypothetical protein [Bacteroidota bacterium]